MGELSKDMTAHVLALVQSYFAAAQFEKNAQDIDPARRRLQEINGSANAFWSSLMAGEGDDADFEVKWAINQVLGKDKITFNPNPGSEASARNQSVAEMIDTMTKFVAACILAEQELDALGRERYYREGESWENLIKGMVFLFLKAGLPVTAAKPHNPSAKPSAFIGFINELQTHFPQRYRRHTHGGVSALTAKLARIVPQFKKDWRALNKSEE